MGITVDIHKKLGDFTLDIAFRSDAKRIGILGASGCGKSLTLKSIAGIERPDRGYIELTGAVGAGPAGTQLSESGPAGARPSDSSAVRTGAAGIRLSEAGAAGARVLFDSDSRINLKPQKRRVGYMFQNYALFPTMTVEANIAAGLRLPPRQRLARVREMIDRFRLQGLEKHLPGQLSGGQQQRVALARIMAYQPDLILLDEPFSALDQHLKERLQHEMMSMLEDFDSQVIMVSHSRDELYRFSQDLLIMENGRLLAGGKTLDLFDDPGTVAVARMTGCKNFSKAVRLDAHRLWLSDWGLDLKLGREIPEDVTAIGYRAHFFQPIWGEKQENCLPFLLSGVDELPFERRYYLHPAAEPASGTGPSPSPDPTSGTGPSPSPTHPFGTGPSPSPAHPSGTGSSPSPAHPSGTGSPSPAEPPDLICWFVQDRERRALDSCPAPDFLQLKEEAVMLLRD